MRASPLLVLTLAISFLGGQVPPPQIFRQWLGGQEVGGRVVETTLQGKVREIRSREWMVLARQGQELRQEVTQTVRKNPEGALTFTWEVRLSTEPYVGRAEWSPGTPGILAVQPAHGQAVRKDVPPQANLWPEDLEAKLKEAARQGKPVQATTFSFPLQQWSSLDLTPAGPDPLPGFPDAVRFTGQEQEGPITLPVEYWFSPTAGELKQRTQLGGLELITQRADLPAPPRTSQEKGLFDRTLGRLPAHPFLPWMPGLVMRVEGTMPDLPEDAQQTRLGPGSWRLRRASPPTAAEATQLPVDGKPAPEDIRYLAASPLVQFQDPAFEGLIRRMALPKGLSRWDLARRVNAFVFDWITEKDYTVGFASALEVCHNPRGDCTEHGVLAVALLRRLGVPARGVTGWVGLGELVGLHFWVEIRLKDRWVPIDPTFDQVPASALRLKVADTDLADMGNVAWEGAAADLSSVRWHPDWEAPLAIQGDQISGPGGIQLRLPKARWALQDGVLTLRPPTGSTWRIQAVVRPAEAQLRGAVRMAGARTLRKGWWHAVSRRLLMDLSDGRWLQVDGISEPEAYDLLDQLMAPTSSS